MSVKKPHPMLENRWISPTLIIVSVSYGILKYRVRGI